GGDASPGEPRPGTRDSGWAGGGAGPGGGGLPVPVPERAVAAVASRDPGSVPEVRPRLDRVRETVLAPRLVHPDRCRVGEVHRPASRQHRDTNLFGDVVVGEYVGREPGRFRSESTRLNSSHVK